MPRKHGSGSRDVAPVSGCDCGCCYILDHPRLSDHFPRGLSPEGARGAHAAREWNQARRQIAEDGVQTTWAKLSMDEAKRAEQVEAYTPREPGSSVSGGTPRLGRGRRGSSPRTPTLLDQLEEGSS